jgi:hypothetical protein
MRRALVATFAVALLAGCGQSANPSKTEEAKGPVAEPAVAADPSFTGFKHAEAQEHFGYYSPATEVKVGNFKLDNLAVAGPIAFKTWEGGERTRSFAPVMLEFVDVTSPSRTNALGTQVYSVKLKALPTAYALGDGKLRFAGTNSKLGEVRFEGVFDEAALKRANANAPDAKTAAVLSGALQVGDTPFKNVTFTWVGGG